MIPASTRIDRRPGQPAVNAVTSVSSVRPTARRLRRIGAERSVSAFATAPNTCRPALAASTLPTSRLSTRPSVPLVHRQPQRAPRRSQKVAGIARRRIRTVALRQATAFGGWIRSSWHVRGDCPPPIHRLDEQCELRRRQNHLAVHDRRPDKLAGLEGVGEQA